MFVSKKKYRRALLEINIQKAMINSLTHELNKQVKPSVKKIATAKKAVAKKKETK